MIKKQFLYTVLAFLMLNVFYSFTLSAQNVDKAYQYFTAKQYKEAAAEFEVAIPVIQEQKGEKDTSLYSKVLFYAAYSYEYLRNSEKAEKYYLQCISVYKEVNGTQNLMYGLSCNNLARVYKSSKNFEKAVQFYIEAKKVYKEVVGNEHTDYAAICRYLAELYHFLGDYDKAEQNYLAALEIYKTTLGEEHEYYATTCMKMGALYKVMQLYDKSTKYFLVAQKLSEKLRGKESNSYIEITNALAEIYKLDGRYNLSEQYFLAIKALGEKVYGKEHASFAEICYNLAGLYLKMGRYQEAEPLYLTSKKIYANLQGDTSLSYSTNCLGLAKLYKSWGKYTQAEPLFLKAKELREKLLGNKHSLYGQVVAELANFYKAVGDFRKAEPLYIEAKNNYQNLFGKESTSYASICNALGLFYKATGDYEQSEQLYFETERIYKKVYGEKHPKYASVCVNMAELYRKTGEYDKAEFLHLKAKQIYETILGKNDPKYALVCSKLARVYISKGKFRKAEQLALQSKEIREKVFGKNDVNYAESCDNLSELYKNTGNYQKAIDFSIEAKNIREKVLGNNHPAYASSCNNLADIYVAASFYINEPDLRKAARKKAVELFLIAKNICETSYGKNNADYASCCNNLGQLYSRIEVYNRAEELLVEAKLIREKVYGKDHPNYAGSCNNLAEIHKKTGNYKKAEPLYLEAKETIEKLYGKRHPHYLAACNNLASLYRLTGNYQKAEDLYLEASEGLSFLAKESAKYMSENEREQYLRMNINFYFEIYDSYFLTQRKDKEELTGVVYNNALNKKGQLLKSTVAIRKAVLQSNNKKLISTYKEYNSIGKLLARQYTIPVSKRRTDIKELEEKLNALEKELTLKMSSIEIGELNWRDVQKSLNNDEAAIEFIAFRHKDGKKWTGKVLYYALVLRKEDKYPKAAFLFEEKQLKKLLKRESSENDFEFVKRLYSGSSSQSDSLYKLVFKPLESYLVNKQKLYISPVGLLNKVAFDALTCDSTNILLDKFDIFYTSSTAINTNKTGLYPKDLKDIALFGGIEYSLSDEEMLEIANTFTSNEENKVFAMDILAGEAEAQSRKIDSLSRNVSWSYLPGSLEETEKIRDVLTGKNVNIKFYSNKEGSEEQFKALENKAPSIIHVSTHGFYFGNDEKSQEYKDMIDDEVKFAHSANPLLRSGFILAGGNNAFQGKEIPDGVEDGVLTALEISRLNFFNTQLAVLSACQTGLGDVKGFEGVYGLQRAFKMAGVDYLLFSLWEVPDYQTKELMTSFYTNWFTGMEIHDAFKKAQMQLKTKYAKMEGGAFAWAAFVLMK